jgi:hypothetical protein
MPPTMEAPNPFQQARERQVFPLEDEDGEDFPGSQDPAVLRELLQQEKKKRYESERKRKESEIKSIPYAITEETLRRAFSAVAQNSRNAGRSPTRMPPPGAPGAPEIFKGVNSKLLPEFFRRFEQCLAEAEVEDDRESLSHLLKYVGTTVGEWIQGHTSYKAGAYLATKRALLAMYDNPDKEDAYTSRDLAALAQEYSESEVTHPDQLSERLMVFETISSKLLDAKKINEEDRDTLYFKTFTTTMREQIREHLSKAEPWHPRHRAFSVDRVCRAAKHLLDPDFDQEIKGDPRTTGQRLIEEARKQKAEEEPLKVTDGGLYEVISKMKKLTISDPVYETYYVHLCKNYPDAAALVARPTRHVAENPPAPPVQSSYRSNIPENTNQVRWGPRTEWPRDKCYYCGSDGCSMSRCQKLQTDINDGLVVKDGMTLTYKTGERLYRRDEGIRADVLAKRAREVQEKNKKDLPPHQTNAYVIDEGEFSGYYIGIQEIDPNEVYGCAVNREPDDCTTDRQEDSLVSYAESYYAEMLQDGVEGNEAQEKAWVMAQTRLAKSIKEAKESAKPYDREKGKGKAKSVRFDEEEKTSLPSVKPALFPPQPARFPPAAPMPPQPLSVPNPPASEWPRSAVSPLKAPNPEATNQASTSKALPTPKPLKPLLPYPAPPKASVIQEIDMTMKDPGPKYRFTSDVEEGVNVSKTIEQIIGLCTVNIDLKDLLALSPAMRKHLTEMTKTKRVPTSDTIARSTKKVLTMEEDISPDEEYTSLPVVEAVSSDRSPRYSGALPRIHAEIGGTIAVGMMDTGSQINLMTREFWMKTGLPLNEGRKIRMQGVNLTGDQSMGLCEHVEVPFAGVVTKAHFHVFEKAPYPFILGQPWIQDHLLAITETGHTNKILIRDFKDPKNRVTMVLRNDPDSTARGDLPTVVEMGTPTGVEVSAYIGIVEDIVVKPEVFEMLEEGLGEADQRDIRTVDALTGISETRPLSFRRQL